MTKIIVISDTHIKNSQYILPSNFLDDVKNADLLIHCGDIKTIDFYNSLLGISKQLEAVCGNTDEFSLRQILPDRKIISINNVTIGIIHGWGEAFNLYKRVIDLFVNSGDVPDIILFGHSHIFFNKWVNVNGKDVLVLNPGSFTDSRLGKNSYAVLNIDKKGKFTVIKKVV